jgi:hypothetical protein
MHSDRRDFPGNWKQHSGLPAELPADDRTKSKEETAGPRRVKVRKPQPRYGKPGIRAYLDHYLAAVMTAVCPRDKFLTPIRMSFAIES